MGKPLPSKLKALGVIPSTIENKQTTTTTNIRKVIKNLKANMGQTVLSFVPSNNCNPSTARALGQGIGCAYKRNNHKGLKRKRSRPKSVAGIRERSQGG